MLRQVPTPQRSRCTWHSSTSAHRHIQCHTHTHTHTVSARSYTSTHCCQSVCHSTLWDQRSLRAAPHVIVGLTANISQKHGTIKPCQFYKWPLCWLCYWKLVMSSYSSTDHLLSIIAASLETRRLAITGNLHTLPAVTTATNENYLLIQWRRQDLLQGGAKLEIRSWGTHGGLQGWAQQLLDD